MLNTLEVGNMAQSKWWIGALAAPLLWAAAGHAQSFVHVRGGATTCSAATFSSCTIGDTCEAAGGLPGECRGREGGGTYCRPLGAVSCCADGNCEGSATCVLLDGGPDGVCLPDLTEVCRDPDGVSGAQLLACFTSPGGTRGPLPEGDCDSDGVSNSAEAAARAGETRMEIAFTVCTAPVPRGVVLHDGCIELPACQTPGADCAYDQNGGSPLGECELTPDDASLRCTPEEHSELYCDDDELECLTEDQGFDPPLESTELGSDGGYYCVPVECEDEVPLAQCLASPFAEDTDPPVPYDAGDCDLDDIPNSDERDGPSICDSDLAQDAGPPELDAGPDGGPIEPGIDAGPQPDAGTLAQDAGTAGADGGGVTVDAGDVDAGPASPSFSGGGGCACHVGASGAPLGPLSGLGLLGLLALAHRRRR